MSAEQPYLLRNSRDGSVHFQNAAELMKLIQRGLVQLYFVTVCSDWIFTLILY